MLSTFPDDPDAWQLGDFVDEFIEKYHLQRHQATDSPGSGVQIRIQMGQLGPSSDSTNLFTREARNFWINLCQRGKLYKSRKLAYSNNYTKDVESRE
jgi:hypothetical protein